MMRRVETASHYVGGMLLVTNIAPGVLEPQVARALAEADPNLAVITIRTLEQQVERTLRSAARGGQPRGTVRRRGAAPGRDRALRRHGILGGPPDERDRRPHGARRRPRACHRPRAGWRLPPRCGRAWLLGLPSPSAPVICCRRSSTGCPSGIRRRSAWPRPHWPSRRSSPRCCRPREPPRWRR